VVFDVQEITPYILSIFESFPWWKGYQPSPVSLEEQKENQCPWKNRRRKTSV
jgi:hypothetical protein